MADVTLTIVTETINTRSADLVAVGASVTAGQTFAIDTAANMHGETRDLLLFMEEQNSGVATVTIDGGDFPPSALAADLTISLAQADNRFVCLQPGQFVQSDGTITGSVATNTVKLYAVRLPRQM